MGFQVYDIKRVYDKIHEIKMGAKTFIDLSLLISNRQSHIPQKFAAPSGRGGYEITEIKRGWRDF